MTTSRASARPLATAAVASIAVLGSILAVSIASTPATADIESVNPFSSAGGFSVYVRNNAELHNTEIEGALAVGGTLQARVPGQRYPIVHYVAGTADYVPPVIDGDATRLLIAGFSPLSGIVDVTGAGAPTGVEPGYAKVVNPVLDFTPRGGYVQYRDADISGSEANGPVIEGKNHVWATDGVAKFTALGSSVAEYVEQGTDFATVTQCLANLDPTATHEVTVTEDGGKAKLDLVADAINVIDYEDLFFGSTYAAQITYAGTVRPSATSPVIVKVPAGTTTVKGSVFGEAGEFANYVMWDLSELTGAVTLTDKSGTSTRIDGSVYAPNADLTAYFGPLDGQVIASSLVTPAGTGELHAYMFKATIPCAIDDEVTTSPSSSASTSPSASASASPSVTTTSSPAPSVTNTGGAELDDEDDNGGDNSGDDNEDDGNASDDNAGGNLSSTGFSDIVLGYVAMGAVFAGAALVGITRRNRAS